MARTKKQPKVEIYNEEKHDVAYDFGEVKCPVSWDEVTLDMYSKFTKLEEISVIDIISIFTGMEREKVELLPVEFSERLLANLSFINVMPETAKPSNRITIDGEDYVVKYQEQMGTYEMVDYDKVRTADEHDYAGMLAVVCRKVTGTKHNTQTGQHYLDNEPYTSEFANTVFDDRKAMFGRQPITKIMPLVNFFFLRFAEVRSLSPEYLRTIDRQLRELVKDIRSSLDSGDFTASFVRRQKKNLRKLEKSLDGLGISS